MIEASTPDIWEPWPSNPLYVVSNMGEVKSTAHVDHRGRPWPGKMLKPFATGSRRNYLCVSIEGKSVKVHRMVAELFLEPDLHRTHVNHINGNTRDNRVGNLEWCTPKENSIHSFQVLGRISCGGHKGKTGAKHHASKRVYAYPPGSQEPLEFGSGAEAARHIGCGAGSVPRACNGLQATVKGWRVHYV